MKRLLLTGFFLLVTVPTSQARLLPSFWSGYSSWHATHVVVIDGDGKVLASWKGDLKVGQKLDLAPLKIPPTPAVAKRYVKGPNDVQVMTDRRRLLFLRREAQKWEPAASFGGMQVSSVWVEGDHLFAFVQEQNPGPTELIPLDMREGDLKTYVVEAGKIQDELLKASREPDLVKRAQAVLPFLENRKVYGPHNEALKILSGCGTAPLTVLRPLLEDDARLSLHGDLIGVIGKAGGKEATRELERMLERELIYWKNAAPNLGKWWGQEPMTMHYGRLIQVLRQLLSIGYKDERKLVKTLRDFWQSKPQLDYIGKGDLPGSKSQVVEEAEAILRR